MIARINGTLIEKTPVSLVVEAMGVGYEVFVPLTTFYELPDVGENIVLHICTQVRADAITLFGFSSQREKDIFQLLITVTGIGPKLALNILSGTDPQELVRSVARGDLNRLVRIPGVGKKTAERIIFDLRDKKIAEISGTQTDEKTLSADVQEMKDDALSALMNLGYKNQAVQDVLERVLRDAGDEEMPLDILLKKTLKILAN